MMVLKQHQQHANRRHGLGFLLLFLLKNHCIQPCHGDLMPIDDVINIGDGMAGIHGTASIYRPKNYLLAPIHLLYPDLQVALLTDGNHTNWGITPYQAIKQDMVIDVMVVPSPAHEDCGPYYKTDAPRCSNSQLLPLHGIGRFLPKNNSTSDNKNKVQFCCTAKDVQAGFCTTPNTILLNATTFQGQHVQWKIPVGESRVSPDELKASSIRLDKSGHYLFVWASCSIDSVDSQSNNRAFYILTFGNIQWKTVTGFLSYPFLLLWILTAGLACAHAITWAGYLRLAWQAATRGTTAFLSKPAEQGVVIVLTLGLLGAILNNMYFWLVNSKGTKNYSLVLAGEVIQDLKMCLSLYWGMLLAQAVGMPTPVDDDRTQQDRVANSRTCLRTCIGLYALVVVLHTVASIGSEWAAEKEAFNMFSDRDPYYELSVESYLTILATYVLAVLFQIFMVIWMLVALVRTIRYLRALDSERTTRLRYLRLRTILVVSTIASMATFMGSTASALLWIAPAGGAVDPIAWTFYVSWLHDAIYFGTLASIAYLWRPDANTREYANLTSLLLNAPQDHDDDQVEAVAPSPANDHELDLTLVEPSSSDDGGDNNEEEDRIEESHPADSQETTTLENDSSSIHDSSTPDVRAIV